VNSKSTQGRRSATYRNIDAESAGQRIDNFLLSHLKGVPRSHVYRLVRSGQVRVNSGRVAPSYRLQDGDRVRIPPVRARDREPVTLDTAELQWLERRIVFEDDRLMVVDKPAGLAVHGGASISLGCIEALRVLRPDQRTLELVHRLDRATSGCLLVAKRRSALRELHALLRENRVDKHYLALVRGHWPARRKRVELPLVAHRRDHEARVRVAPDGRSAVSHFRVLERFGKLATLVDVAIETGRTHQIRVHAAESGHPIAGDERYGDEAFDRLLEPYGLARMFLHASSVAFDWPAQRRLFGICVPLPRELGAVVAALRRLHSQGVESERAQGAR
jgi:23S rRNA pseudouridine955/2504/2580 synthase